MTEELYNFWFNQETRYLLKLKNKKYIPEILDIDYKKRKITFRWYDKSLNALIENNEIKCFGKAGQVDNTKNKNQLFYIIKSTFYISDMLIDLHFLFASWLK